MLAQIRVVPPPEIVIPLPLMVVALVSAGNSEVTVMVPPTVMLMVCGADPSLFASSMACRSDPAPLLSVFTTVKVVANAQCAKSNSAAKMAADLVRFFLTGSFE